MEKHVSKYQERDEDGTPGREIVFTDIDFRPLGYEALRDAKLHQPIKIPVDRARRNRRQRCCRY